MAACILERSVRTFSRRIAEASLRLRGFLNADLLATSASRRLGDGRPLPPALPWGSAGTVVSDSDLERRNTGSEPHSQGRSRLGVVPGPRYPESYRGQHRGRS